MKMKEHVWNLTTSVPWLNSGRNFRNPEFGPPIRFLYVRKERQDGINCRGIEKYGGFPRPI